MTRNKNKYKGRKQIELTDSVPVKVEGQPHRATGFSPNAVVIKNERELHDASQSMADEKYIKKEDQQHIKKGDQQHIKKEDQQHIKKENQQDIKKENGQHIRQEDGQHIKQEDGQDIKKEGQRRHTTSSSAFYPSSHRDLIKKGKEIIYTPTSTTCPSPNPSTFKREYDGIPSGSSKTDLAMKENQLHHGFPSCTFDSDDLNAAMKENRLHHRSASERFDSYGTDSMWKENQLHHGTSSSKYRSHDTDLMRKENQLHHEPQAQPASVRQAYVHQPPVLPRGWKPPADPEPDRGATYTIPNYKDRMLWPASLKHYIARSFEDILPEEWDPVYRELHAIILEACRDDIQLCVDWDKMPLPNVIRHDIRIAELRKLKQEIAELDELQRIEDEERGKVWLKRKMERDKERAPKRETVGPSSPPNITAKHKEHIKLEERQNDQTSPGGRGYTQRRQQAIKAEVYDSDDSDHLSEACFRLSDNSELDYTHEPHGIGASNHPELAAMSGLDLKATKRQNTDYSLWDTEQLHPNDSISQVGSQNGCEDLHDMASTFRGRKTFTFTNNEQASGMKTSYQLDDSSVSSMALDGGVTIPDREEAAFTFSRVRVRRAISGLQVTLQMIDQLLEGTHIQVPLKLKNPFIPRDPFVLGDPFIPRAMVRIFNKREFGALTHMQEVKAIVRGIPILPATLLEVTLISLADSPPGLQLPKWKPSI
ncbi:uncharacterized protein H6S33_010889 [Morchella sextelata]|uniref:uncharacterized protein n=1 Tax=Morchella sextelata TaxID=1174677 RepID=UPI001D03C12E|nr:uncharacterized protein H6S33_010889 [Morchella sextelata]KAH0611624.1 hypothetical protein H6S33_010889 [Morchella sextelata]